MVKEISVAMGFTLFYEVKYEKSQVLSVSAWGFNILTDQKNDIFHCEVYVTVMKKTTLSYIKENGWHSFNRSLLNYLISP